MFSSLHVTGAQLDLYTGVAGTLRFPLPDIDLELAAQAPSKPTKNTGEMCAEFLVMSVPCCYLLYSLLIR